MRTGTDVRAWAIGCGLAVAEWVAALGLASLIWYVVRSDFAFALGAAACIGLLLLWSAVGGLVLAWAVTCR